MAGRPVNRSEAGQPCVLTGLAGAVPAVWLILSRYCNTKALWCYIITLSSPSWPNSIGWDRFSISECFWWSWYSTQRAGGEDFYQGSPRTHPHSKGSSTRQSPHRFTRLKTKQKPGGNQQMHSDTVTYICTDNKGVRALKHTQTMAATNATSTTEKAAYKTKQQCINMQLNYQPAVLLQNTQIHIYKARTRTLTLCTYEECPAVNDCLHILHEACVTHTHTQTHTHVHIHWHTQLGGCRNKSTLTLIAWRSTARRAAPPLAFTCRLPLPSPLLFLFFRRHSGVSPWLEGGRKKNPTHLPFSWISAASPASLPPCLSSPSPLPVVSPNHPLPPPPQPPRRSPSSLLSLLPHRRTVCPLIPYNSLHSSLHRYTCLPPPPPSY